MSELLSPQMILHTGWPCSTPIAFCLAFLVKSLRTNAKEFELNSAMIVTIESFPFLFFRQHHANLSNAIRQSILPFAPSHSNP